MEVQTDGKFRYLESTTGHPDTLLLLHGLFGALSNFKDLFEHFSAKYNVVVPILPIYEMPMLDVSVTGLVEHVCAFLDRKNYQRIHLLGNSLGGHVAILTAIAHPQRIASVTLTGSSGLFESAFGSAFPKRGDYDYISKKTADTFYDPATATKELIDEVFEVVNDRSKGLRIVMMAKSAVRHNLADKLHLVKAPTLLIWGKQDIVTPPFVGEKFHELLPNSQLFLLDKCGHAPMMELPEQFNSILEKFLEGLGK